MNNNKFLNEIGDLLLSYWNGKQKLWKAFWLIGFVLQFVLIIFFGIFNLIGIALGLTWSIKFIIFLINIIYTIWVLVSIWNCAYNVKNKIWGDLSRVIVVLNVILLFLIYTGIISFDYQNIIQKNP